MGEAKVLIAKMVGDREWKRVPVPIYKEPYNEFYAFKMLESSPIEYVEWVASGIVYRLIRQSVANAYGISKEDDRQ